MAAAGIFITTHGRFYSDGQLEVELVPVAGHDNGSIRSLLGDFHCLKPLGDLRIDLHPAIARLDGNNSAKSLVEPAAYAVVAVVHTASVRSPIFPC